MFMCLFYKKNVIQVGRSGWGHLPNAVNINACPISSFMQFQWQVYLSIYVFVSGSLQFLEFTLQYYFLKGIRELLDDYAI